MKNPFNRTEMLLGKKNIEKLKNIKVAIFGIGGVGSYACEALVRCGIGSIVLVDHDIIDVTNINRQIHATFKTVGRSKVQVMKERALDINPDISVDTYKECLDESNIDCLVNIEYDYVIDAIDMISSKLILIEKCKEFNIPIISCMGAGNKLNPSLFQVGDIYETSMCPLAKIMRKELRKRNIMDLKVVWSKERPIKSILKKENTKKISPGSISFVPSVAGLIIASEVVKDILEEEFSWNE